MEGILNFFKEPGMINILSPVVAQALTFLIFLWILKKFAWKPILNVLDSRRNHITSEFERIGTLEKEVNTLKTNYEEKIKNIESEARTKIQEAVNDGRRVAEEIAEKARADARIITEKAKKKVDIELAKARAQLKDEVITLTLKTAEKLMRVTIDENKNRALIDSFIDDMENAE